MCVSNLLFSHLGNVEVKWQALGPFKNLRSSLKQALYGFYETRGQLKLIKTISFAQANLPSNCEPNKTKVVYPKTRSIMSEPNMSNYCYGKINKNEPDESTIHKGHCNSRH